jgi:short-subunit dehydrogenase
MGALMKVAVVTGASAGLGAEFVRQIDAGFDVDELWLVARRRRPMEELARELTRARGVPIVADLSTDEGLGFLFDRLEKGQPDLKLLVNNAGVGMFGHFEKIDKKKQLEMIDLNVRSLTEITHQALKYMSEGGIIVQVASIVGLFPLSGWSVYSATKAYIISFSCGLAGELKSRGIKCTVCCPGLMKTDFWAASSGRLKMPFFNLVSVDPKKVAAKALAHARRGKLVSIKGFLMRFFDLLIGILPRSIFVYFARRMLPKDGS